MCTDLNSALKSEGEDDEAIGPHGNRENRTPNETGEAITNMLRKYDLAAINTFTQGGHTYYNQEERGKTID